MIVCLALLQPWPKSFYSIGALIRRIKALLHGVAQEPCSRRPSTSSALHGPEMRPIGLSPESEAAPKRSLSCSQYTYQDPCRFSCVGYQTASSSSLLRLTSPVQCLHPHVSPLYSLARRSKSSRLPPPLASSPRLPIRAYLPASPISFDCIHTTRALADNQDGSLDFEYRLCAHVQRGRLHALLLGGSTVRYDHPWWNDAY